MIVAAPAPAITCQFVTITPEGRTIKPLPCPSVSPLVEKVTMVTVAGVARAAIVAGDKTVAACALRLNWKGKVVAANSSARRGHVPIFGLWGFPAHDGSCRLACQIPSQSL